MIPDGDSVFTHSHRPSKLVISGGAQPHIGSLQEKINVEMIRSKTDFFI